MTMNVVKPDVRDAWDFLRAALDDSETALTDIQWVSDQVLAYKQGARNARAYRLVCDIGYRRAADRLGYGIEYLQDLVRWHRAKTGDPAVTAYRAQFRPETDWDLSHYVTLDKD